MSDNQIIVLSRGLLAAADGGYQDDDAIFDVGDSMHDQLGSEVRDLATRDPERVRRLVQRATGSPEDADLELAAKAAPGLLDYDYDFTRDTLISIYTGEARERHRSTDRHGTHETAFNRIRFLMRDRLTPEQIADFQAHAAPYNPGRGLEPAAPYE